MQMKSEEEKQIQFLVILSLVAVISCTANKTDERNDWEKYVCFQKSLRICTLSWKKVDRSMVSNYYSHGVRLAFVTDNSGGLIINGQVTNYGCGKGPGSAMVVHIKGDWKQIMYTQVFRGTASCWGIFGNEYQEFNLSANAGLEVFNPTFGDIIFGQKRMQSSADNFFDGKSKRCDNEKNNFWHSNNGSGERQATVILRRKLDVGEGGLSTGTSCGTPSYVINDIYVLQ